MVGLAEASKKLTAGAAKAPPRRVMMMALVNFILSALQRWRWWCAYNFLRLLDWLRVLLGHMRQPEGSGQREAEVAGLDILDVGVIKARWLELSPSLDLFESS
jgi:hypothetical protein